jgi:hypothetical protein
MTFQIHALTAQPFGPLFDLSDSDLEQQGARRVIAQSVPGYPCRVSLREAEVGEELVLCNFHHLEGNTPYAASHAIYVRKGAEQAQPEPGEIPDVLKGRVLSLRGFDADKLIEDAEIVEEAGLAEALGRLFANEAIGFVDIHYAQRGCFAAKATRG